MPRAARDISGTKIYHIMSRGLNKQTLYDDEQDFLYFLKLLKDVKTKTHFELYAYCVMTNHYHLLIKEHDAKISVIMNKINSRYANYYNLKYERTGYVFNDRFHSENIDTMPYLFRCARYIHQNPVKAGLCDKTYNYKFSSVHAYRRQKGNYLNLVDTDFINKNFKSNEFVNWNELESHDRCMDIANNRLSDKEVTNILYKSMKVGNKKEFLKKSEAEQMYYIAKLIDMSIPLKQLSRVTGQSYYKLQRLRRGKVGNVTQLTYKP